MATATWAHLGFLSLLCIDVFLSSHPFAAKTKTHIKPKKVSYAYDYFVCLPTNADRSNQILLLDVLATDLRDESHDPAPCPNKIGGYRE